MAGVPNNRTDHWAVRFYTLWTGQALSLLGSQLVQFSIIWYLTHETKSATTLAIASMMGILPQVVLSPFKGRVFAFIFSAAMLVSPVALMIAGPFADSMGIQLWFLVAGVSCVLMGIFGFFSSDVMAMENKSSVETKHIATKSS